MSQKTAKSPKLDIITIPSSILRAPNKEVKVVDKKIKQVLAKMTDNLLASGGVGLAAPQIGANYRIFATNLIQVEPGFARSQTKKGKFSPSTNPIKFFFNPKITQTAAHREFTKEKDGTYTLEGCLSLPNLYAPVPRYTWIMLEYQELDPDTGELTPPKSEKFTDFYARNVQHEVDHLNQILFTDYLRDTDIILYRGNSRNDKLDEVVDLNFIYAI